MINSVIQGDCLEVLKTFPDNYFDSLVTDPPAGINFMGKEFDKDKGGMLNWINWLSEVMNEAMRTMKPGALGLVWSIPRTSHWTGMALELAGFKIIDIVHHANGSGFPKSQDIGKMLDAMAGEEREVIGRRNPYLDGGERTKYTSATGSDYGKYESIQMIDGTIPITAPATPEAKQWDGWKTPALKPSIEGWWLVQKKIDESSIARNILKHGVGGINIEACRIGTETKLNSSKPKAERNGFIKGFVAGTETEVKNYGRYPANLVLSCEANCEGENHSPDCPVTAIGDQSGISFSSGGKTTTGLKGLCYGNYKGESLGQNAGGLGDKGTAARYFKQLPFDPETIASIYYQAKASKRDRSCNGEVNNNHPTVKSRHLMAYFIKLITPPNGVVLDCFGGSGTTAIAAIENGFNYVLIEKEIEYLEIINQRIQQYKPVEFVAKNVIAVPDKPVVEKTGQLSLF
jgi:site-specific DNA-methyltransferase (adenine-specific)